ncbi:unnamed protein product [Gongylonema pulchrum]|uniref:BACK domain-containing protein n=1 Tax=Gongylonema pulchrum TaxID=637853 RepID=A0A183CW82_9BILA|nr:unnamed protein product [Gongylonema pulchrum]
MNWTFMACFYSGLAASNCHVIWDPCGGPWLRDFKSDADQGGFGEVARAAFMLWSNSDKLKKIIIHSHKDAFAVDVDLFEKYSNKIKRLNQQDKVPKTLDFSNYDVKAVATFVDYMATGGRTKTRITTSILGDLMEIARVLEMKQLYEKIEEFILVSAVKSPQFLMHALTMISKEMLLNTSLGGKVIDIAVSEFPRIAKSSPFSEVPLDVVLRILDRCDLNLETEYDVVEAAISWLTAKPDRVHSSYLVLSCIRIINLTPEQRVDLHSLISTMPNYARTVMAFAHYAFNNTNSHRVCVLAEHASYKRCGNRGGNNEFT